MIKLNTDNLRKVMKKESLTQASLARKLRLSRACINRHLSGSRKHPSALFISAIGEAYPEYSFNYFFTLSGAKEGQKVTGGE